MRILLILIAIITIFISSSFIQPSNAVSKSLSISESHSLPDYIEYVYIDGILWKITYTNDGKISTKEEVFE